MKKNLKTKKCSVCGVDISRPSWQFRRVKNPVCSKECQAKLFTERIDMECAWCGKSLKIIPWKVKRNKNCFCDRECARLYQIGKRGNAYRGSQPVPCDQCGKEVYKYPSEIKASNHHFCNSRCMGDWYKEHPKDNIKEEVECSYCGEKIKRWPFEIKAHKNHFCSASCRKMFFRGENSVNWRGGVSYNPYPPGWKEKLKEKIRSRDYRTCQLCFKEEKDMKNKLHVHHIDGDKFHICEENLISLCTSCHIRLERTGSYLITMLKGLTENVNAA